MHKAATWTVPVDHPAFDGHFPGRPIAPGVVLLDSALHAIAESTGIALEACTINNVKFLSPAQPGDEIVVTYAAAATGLIRFEIMSGVRKIASGSVMPGSPGLTQMSESREPPK